MLRWWFLLLLLFAACLVWWYASRPAPLPPGAPILVERRSSVPEEVVHEAVRVREPQRELPIEGRVFVESPDRYRIRLGQEEAQPDAEGVFAFPSAVRSRWSDVELWRDGELIARERALSGDPAADDDVEDRNLARFPERPARIRWSWNVFPRASDPDLLGIDSAFGEEWGRGGRVVLRGGTELPDAASLNGNLQFERLRFIASIDPAIVESGQYLLEIFCPLDMVFYAGEYRAQVVFNVLLQTVEFRARHPELERAISENGEILVERRLCLGEPERAWREDLAAQQYYARLLDEARRSEQVLQARLEEARLGAKNWDPSLLRERARARVGWFHEQLVDNTGRFDVALWRRFLDEEWRPSIRSLLEEHRARGQEKYMEAADHMGRVLSSLHDLSFMYSKFRVYPLYGLPPAPEDWYEDAYEGGDIVLAERTLRRSTEELQRYRRLVEDFREWSDGCGRP